MAVRFDASGEVVYRSTSLPASTNFSVCGWFSRSGSGGDLWETVCGLTDGSALLVLYGADYNAGSGAPSLDTTSSSTSTFGSVTANNTPYAWAITCSGTGAGTFSGYVRAANSSTWSSTSLAGLSFTPNRLDLGYNNRYSSETLNGRIWNVKVWDRVLTANELLVETVYRRPMFPSSLHAWWPLVAHTDLADYSGAGRGLSSSGTISTESDLWKPWKPGARIYSLAAASGAASVSSAGAIASAQAFGTATLTRTSVASVTGTGIASSEAFGTATVTRVNLQSVSGAGAIASAEAFGTATFTGSTNLTLYPSGIASAEAFGTATVTKTQVETVSGAGAIASAEAFGTATVTRTKLDSVSAAGAIASAEAFGTATLTRSQVASVSVTGIASAEAFGTQVITWRKTVSPSGIASTETFGTAVVSTNNPQILPSGIGSAEVFGTPVLSASYPEQIIVPGIASAEAFGTSTFTRYGAESIIAAGIASAEAFGNPILGSAMATGDELPILVGMTLDGNLIILA